MIDRKSFYRSFREKLKIKGRRHDYLAQLYFTHSTKNSFGTPNKCQIRRIYTSMTPGKAGGYGVEDGFRAPQVPVPEHFGSDTK
jgi:hypothetical protein